MARLSWSNDDGVYGEMAILTSIWCGKRKPFQLCVIYRRLYITKCSFGLISFVCSATIGGGWILFLSRSSGRPAVHALSGWRLAVDCLSIPISHDAMYAHLVEVFEVKLAANIHHVSGHCWKGFKVRRQRSRSLPDRLTYSGGAYISTMWRRGLLFSKSHMKWTDQ